MKAMTLAVAMLVSQSEKPAEEAFKNIQVLKGVPESHVNVAMLAMSSALGVRCAHCHVSTDFSLDKKPAKGVARDMIRMTRELDAAAFGAKGAVSCFTCHRGELVPAAGASSAESALRLHETAAPADAPSPDSLLARHLDAVGGEARVGALRTLAARGTETRVSPDGASPPKKLEVFRKSPDRFLAIAGDQTQGFDGRAGWTRAGGAARPAAGPDLAFARREADFFQNVRLRERYASLESAGVDTIGGRRVHVVVARPIEPAFGSLPTSSERLSFDAETGLLRRRHLDVLSPLGPMPMTVDLDDYRDVAGVRWPATVHFCIGTERITRTFEEIRFGEPIDDSRFAMPEKK